MLCLVLENLRAFPKNQDSANGLRYMRGLFPTSYFSGFSGPSNRDVAFQFHASLLN